MQKLEWMKQYPKEEDRLLLAKAWDKWELSKKRNQITHTDFLDEYQKNKIEEWKKKIQISETFFYGGYENAERVIAVFYPEKFSSKIVEKNIETRVVIIEIQLPNEYQGNYTHRDYLGALMKLGIKREKIGDILVRKEGAQILLLPEIADYVKENLAQLTRFRKAKIEQKEITQIQPVEVNQEEIRILVSSMRVDAIVAELVHTSRSKVEEMIQAGRIFVNFEIVLKGAKLIKEQDKITIRGKGRFLLLERIASTKKGKEILKVIRYV